jgi:GTPase Era involved in 16S rRNA processing
MLTYYKLLMKMKKKIIMSDTPGFHNTKGTFE